MNCGNCGNPLEPGATFCSKCGATIAPLNEAVTQPPVQQVGGIVSTEAPKKKKKFPLILILLLLFAGAGCYGGYYLHGKLKPCNCKNAEVVDKEKNVEDNEEESDKDEEKESKKDSEKDSDSKEDSNKKYYIDASKVKVLDGEDDLSKKIEVVKYLTVESDYSQDFKVLLKNNSDEILEAGADINYLNDQGIRIARDNSTSLVEPGDYFAINVYVNVKEPFSSVTIVPKAQKKKSYYYTVDYTQEEFVEAVTSSGIELTYKNNTDKKLSGNFTVLCYKNDEIVDFTDGNMTTVEPGVSGKVQFYTIKLIGGYDRSKKFPDDFFDKYEVEVNSLYYYESGF